MDPISPSSVILSVVLGGVLLLWVLYLKPGWKTPSKSGARVPLGSFGWPLIGETLAFSHNPSQFASSRVKRYGTIFRSHLFFRPAIVGTTTEFAKLVISNSALFASGWPESVKGVIGSKAFVFKDGAAHMSVKKLLQKAFLPESLKSQVATLEEIVLENLNCWADKGSIVSREGTQKAKAALTKYFKYLLEEKKGEENHQSDILGVLLTAIDDPQSREEVKDLDDETVADNLVLMWFGSFDTTATTLTWILKLLLDHPDIYQKVQAEQLEILKGKDPSQKRLTWEDTRKMVYTTKFFMELQRYVSISACVVRTATQDVEYEGHLIPKGWAVTVMFNIIHTNPTNWSDPMKFDPSRHDATPKPCTYLPFSTGPHICPGIEIAKLVSLIFIHHLTTTFVHESAAPDQGIVYNSFPSPKGGYPINIRRRNAPT